MNTDEALGFLKFADSSPGMNPLLFAEITKAVIDHLHKFETDKNYRGLVLMLNKVKPPTFSE